MYLAAFPNSRRILSIRTHILDKILQETQVIILENKLFQSFLQVKLFLLQYKQNGVIYWEKDSFLYTSED